MMLPIVSVIVLTYDNHLEIEECLGSLERQTSRDFEVIVVADETTRELLRVLEGFRIHLVSNDKMRGISAARNMGVENARGDIIAFIDDDVVAEKDWVENILETFKNEEVMATRGLVIPKNETIYNRVAYFYNLGAEEKFSGSLLGCNMVIRKSALEKTGLFDEKLDYGHDELDMSLRLLKAGIRIIYSPKTIVRHNYCESIITLMKKNMKFGEKEAYLIRKYGFDFVTVRYVLGIISSLGILCSPLGLFFPIAIVPSTLLFLFFLAFGIGKCMSFSAGFLFVLANVVRTASLIRSIFRKSSY